MVRKLSNRSEGGATVSRRSGETGTRLRAELVFAGAVVAGFAVWGVSTALLSADLVMPLVATTFLVLAAALGVVALRYRGMDPNRVTYTDVAGALTLIGVFASAAIEPEQMLRLLASH
jgi:hypothetical protein